MKPKPINDMKKKTQLDLYSAAESTARALLGVAGDPAREQIILDAFKSGGFPDEFWTPFRSMVSDRQAHYTFLDTQTLEKEKE